MNKTISSLLACTLGACVMDEDGPGDDEVTVEMTSDQVSDLDNAPTICRPNLVTTALLTDRYGTEVNGCSRSMYQLVLVVTNIGCATANPSTFRFQRKDGTFITYPVGSLVPDASARFTILSYTYSGGEYARTATADFTHVVAESNENDNTAYWNCIL